MSNYLYDRRIEMGLTQKEVANAVGVAEATVSRWESGNIANMKRDKIFALSRVLNCSPEFIMTGNHTPAELPDNIIPMPKMNKVPLLGSIACGEPILAVENIESEVDIPDHIRADFALRCRGDSMINARIFDGDIVYIRHQPIVENGEIAAVLIGEEATLKRVRLFPDHIVLEPENPLYRPLVYWGEDMDNVNIIGLAVAFTGCVR